MEMRKFIILIVLILAIASVIICAMYFNSLNPVINNNNNNLANTTNQDEEKVVNVDPYAKYKNFPWMRETSAGYTELKFEIIDSKLYIVDKKNKTLITTVKGVPKYLNGLIEGGIMAGVICITEEGTVWKSGAIDDSVTIKVEDNFTQIQISEKVIDMTMGGLGVVPYSGPYYLTEKGNLLRSDGKTYEQINGKHVYSTGTLFTPVYVNTDRTASYQRTLGVDEFILNEQGKKVIFKQIFTNTSEDYTYVVTDDNKLYTFSKDTLMVASEYSKAKGKIVSSIKMTAQDTITVEFTDRTTLDLEGIYDYYDAIISKELKFDK